MIDKIAIRCIDINTGYCPCMLAETNNCVYCSHLKGGETCDCNWTGVCIMYEKKWQTKKQRWRGDDTPVRIEIETELTKKELLAENTYLLQFDVSETLAEQLNKIGAFIFMRKPEDPQFYHLPIGIMKVDKQTIQVVVEDVGPKSARLLANDHNRIWLRGPYFNGYFGQPWIENVKCGKILLVAGGMGQPPALPVVEKLIANGNNVVAIIAPGKTKKVFVEQAMLQLGAQVHVVASLRQVGIPMLRALFKSSECPELVVSAGPDDQHYGIIAAMQAADVNLPMAATNNATMCCGEGICGSCIKETQTGEFIKTCKVQTDFTQLIQD